MGKIAKISVWGGPIFDLRGEVRLVLGGSKLHFGGGRLCEVCLSGLALFDSSPKGASAKYVTRDTRGVGLAEAVTVTQN